MTDFSELLSAATQEQNMRNGEQLPEIIHADPKMSARLKAIEMGMVEFQAVCAERDEWKRRYEDEHLKSAELGIAIDQARESERIRVAKITQDLIVEGKKAEVEINRLGEEIDELRSRLSASEDRRQVAVAEKEHLSATLDLIRAAITKVIGG